MRVDTLSYCSLYWSKKPHHVKSSTALGGELSTSPERGEVPLDSLLRSTSSTRRQSGRTDTEA